MSSTAAKLRFEADPRQLSVRVYESSEVDYDASCQVFRYGDRGFMYSITGAGFYRCWCQPNVLQDLFSKLNVKTLEGYVTRAHARLMRAALREHGGVEITGTGTMAGREMVWVCVTLKEPN